MNPYTVWLSSNKTSKYRTATTDGELVYCQWDLATNCNFNELCFTRTKVADDANYTFDANGNVEQRDSFVEYSFPIGEDLVICGTQGPVIQQSLLPPDPFQGTYFTEDVILGTTKYSVSSSQVASYLGTTSCGNSRVYRNGLIEVTLSEPWLKTDSYIRGKMVQYCQDSIVEQWTDWSDAEPCLGKNGIRAQWRVDLIRLTSNTEYTFVMYYYIGDEVYSNTTIVFDSEDNTEVTLTGEVPLVPNSVVVAKKYTIGS